MRVDRFIIPSLLLGLLAACGGGSVSIKDLPRITYNAEDIQTIFGQDFRVFGSQPDGNQPFTINGTPVAEFTPPPDFTPPAGFQGRPGGFRNGTPVADFTPSADFQGRAGGQRSFVIKDGAIESVLTDTNEVLMTIRPAIADGGIAVTVEFNGSQQTMPQEFIDQMAAGYAEALWNDLQAKGMTGTLVDVEISDGVMAVVYQP